MDPEWSSIAEDASRELKNVEFLSHSANKVFKRAHTDCQKLDSLHAKLELVIIQLEKQLQTVDFLVMKLSSHCAKLQMAITRVQKSSQYAMDNLSAVFEEMANNTIDHRLKEASSLTEDSLYDFVDVDSVNKLLEKGKCEVHKFTIHQSQVTQIMKDIEENCVPFREECAKSLKIDDHRLGDVSQATSALSKDMKFISDSVLSVAGQYDSITFSMGDVTMSLMDISAARDVVEEMGATGRVVQLAHDRLKSQEEDIEGRMLKYKEQYQRAATIHSRLNVIGPMLRERLLNVNTMRVAFDDCRQDTRLIFEEMSTLYSWYRSCVQAYKQVNDEVKRRNRVLARQQEVVNRFAKELEEMWVDEQNARDDFYESYGCYLPSTLCPALLEPAIRHQVAPRFCVSNLPKLEESDEDTAALEGEESDGEENMAETGYEAGPSNPLSL